MPAAGPVLCALFRYTGHAFDHAQTAKIRENARVLGQNQRFVLYPGLEQGHGFPVPAFGNHDLAHLFGAVLLPRGFGQGRAVAPRIQGYAGKTGQLVENGEKNLLLGPVRAVPQL